VQDVRDVLGPARADAIGAFLIFLHLLERQIKAVTEFGVGAQPVTARAISANLRTRQRL
jgi:hypothetical protein